MKSHANKLAVAVAACSLSLSGLTQAQKLEEVVVTAAKVEASIQDTPIAVTAFSQEALDSQLINDASAMQFSVPNLTQTKGCLLYTSPSPRDGLLSRMPSSA